MGVALERQLEFMIIGVLREPLSGGNWVRVVCVCVCVRARGVCVCVRVILSQRPNHYFCVMVALEASALHLLSWKIKLKLRVGPFSWLAWCHTVFWGDRSAKVTTQISDIFGAQLRTKVSSFEASVVSPGLPALYTFARTVLAIVLHLSSLLSERASHSVEMLPTLLIL